MQSAECRKAGQSHSKVGFGATRSAARQSRNRSLEGLAAEHVHVRIRALPPERRIYAAVGRKTRPLPHKCGVPARGSPGFGGGARMRPIPRCMSETNCGSPGESWERHRYFAVVPLIPDRMALR